LEEFLPVEGGTGTILGQESEKDPIQRNNSTINVSCGSMRDLPLWPLPKLRLGNHGEILKSGSRNQIRMKRIVWCRGAELNRRHTDFQFRSRTLPKLTKTYQLNALCPIWQVGSLPNPTNYYQETWEANGRRIYRNSGNLAVNA
jgi:hypothetical protein